MNGRRDAQRRFRAIAAGFLVAALVAVGCGGGAKTFEDDAYAITFEYPGDWGVDDNPSTSAQAGARSVASKGIGRDRHNLILVEKYQLKIEVTKANLDRVKAEADQVFGQLAGKPLSGKATEVAGKPALEYGPIDLDRPKQGKSRFVLVFVGDAEYFLNCQSTPDRRQEVERVCDRALQTLKVKQS